MRKSVDVVCITLTSPIQIGIYEGKRLIETINSDQKSSDVLPLIFQDILQKYEIKALFYVNGPGSFMAIKVAYVFLKSLSVLKNIPLYARDAFYFNNNQPIKAIGKLFFVKMHDEIETKKLETVPVASFKLPDLLEYTDFNEEAAPLYKIAAV
jgi:tRNA A37 threonylcarbamoyladenosine modification protein TsaB